MRTTRRALVLGGAAIAVPPLLRRAYALDPVEIEMRGNADGSAVWFDPVGILLRPGATVRWTNRDPGNDHSTTAYHPGNDGRPLRIPNGAERWDSDYLLPDQSFSVVLTVEGIYDYFCRPHEQAGMVGRLVVGAPDRPDRGQEGGIPEAALRNFPPLERILREGIVRRS